MASTSASARRCLAVLRSSAPSGLDMESMAALRVVPPTGSSQASSRYMPPLSLMKGWRRSKSSSTLAEKPSGSTACHVPAAMSRRSLIEKRLALPIHISSSMGAPIWSTRSCRWQMTEAAWNPISPELSASATIGIDLSWLPTHSRSAAAGLDIWHSLATHEQAFWPDSRCWLRFLAAATAWQSLPWRRSMAALRRLGSTKSSSASRSKSSIADSSLTSSSNMSRYTNFSLVCPYIFSKFIFTADVPSTPPRPPITPSSQSRPLALHSPRMGRRRWKLIFGPSLVKEPVIYQLGRKFEIVTNIRRADVTRDQGWVLLEVSGEPEELDKGVDYLESRGVKVEPAEGDLVE